jgi:ribose-phosphate pyrophosphokinase
MMIVMRIFALDASRSFGETVAGEIGAQLDLHEERVFEDGEHKVRPLVEVRGRDVYVIQSLYGDEVESVGDKLLKLLFFAGVLRENHAARVTAVIPYLAYSRKDRQTKPRDPVTTRYLAQLLEAMGLDMVVTLDVHNLAAFQNAFRIGTLHLDTRSLFAAHIQGLALDGPLIVASPDPGGVKRAQLFREVLERRVKRQVGSAYVEKRRSDDVVSGSLVAGEVEGATVLVLDDLISTGHTMLRTARACLENGAARVLAYAAHGLFTAGANEAMLDPSLSRTVVTDTVSAFRLSAAAREKVEVVSAAPHFARAIRLLHEGGSLVELIGE